MATSRLDVEKLHWRLKGDPDPVIQFIKTFVIQEGAAYSTMTGSVVKETSKTETKLKTVRHHIRVKQVVHIV